MQHPERRGERGDDITFGGGGWRMISHSAHDRAQGQGAAHTYLHTQVNLHLCSRSCAGRGQEARKTAGKFLVDGSLLGTGASNLRESDRCKHLIRQHSAATLSLSRQPPNQITFQTTHQIRLPQRQHKTKNNSSKAQLYQSENVWTPNVFILACTERLQ